MIRFLAILSFSFLILSCEEKRDINLDDFEKEIVVNGIISTDSIFSIHLSYTKSIFEEGDFNFNDNAIVRIQNLTKPLSFIMKKQLDGKYERAYYPVEGNEYLLTVNVEGKEEIRASTYIPSVVDVNVNSKLSYDTNGFEDLEVEIEIIDDPGVSNYYVWELVEINEEAFAQNNEVEEGSEGTPNPRNGGKVIIDGNTSEEEPIDEIEDDISIEEIFSFSGEQDESSPYTSKDLNSYSFLSDDNAKDGKISNKLLIDNSFLPSNIYKPSESEVSGLDDRVPLFELKVMAVSSDLYEYLKAYETYRNSDNKNTSLSNPIPIYSNIENGLGIFGGYSLKSFYIY